MFSPFNMFAENIFGEFPRRFCLEFTCFSVSMLPGNERDDVERGGKIIMPPSSLEILTRLNINYPMVFKLTNDKKKRTTHSGVLEFVADEGRVYLPHWMMRNLLLDEGDVVKLESVSIPVATFSRFQPQTVDFLDITNPKAVLENCLRNFACLTTGDMIAINYNSRIYELCVLETQPGSAVTIIECDMNVDFAPPIGYKEPDRVVPMDNKSDPEPEIFHEPAGFVPFKGSGNRLDGKKRKDSERDEKPVRSIPQVRGIPDYNYEIGFLKFIRTNRASGTKENNEEEETFQPFKGVGFTIKDSMKK